MTDNTINDAVTMGVAITIMHGKLMVTTRMLGKENTIFPIELDYMRL